MCDLKYSHSYFTAGYTKVLVCKILHRREWGAQECALTLTRWGLAGKALFWSHPAIGIYSLNTNKQLSSSNGVPDGETLPRPLNSAPSLNSEWNQLPGKAEGDPAMALEIPSKENKWSARVTRAHRSQRLKGYFRQLIVRKIQKPP